MTSLAKSLNCDGRKGWMLLCFVILLLLGGVAGPSRSFLSFERDAIAGGEWWRLLTAHAMHLDLRHAVMNALGLSLIWFLYFDRWAAPCWLAIGVASLLAVDAGLWWLQPEVRWYVGASGLLHGLWVAGLVGQLFSPERPDRRVAALVAALLGAKLLWESRHGTSVFLHDGMPVVLPAHVYGAFGGLLAAAALIAIMRGLLHRPG